MKKRSFLVEKKNAIQGRESPYNGESLRKKERFRGKKERERGERDDGRCNGLRTISNQNGT